MEETSEWFEAKYSDNAILRLRISARIYSSQSAFQKIEIMDSVQFGRMLVLDNVINVTERDEFIYHEMMAHVPLCIHPNPEKILIIGGGDGGTIREAVKHPALQEAHLVEIDPQVVAVARKYLPQLSSALEDTRVTVIYQDAVAYVQAKSSAYDVIIVDSTDPFGPGQGLFSPAFYQDCFRALTDNGILTAQSESPFYDPAIVADIYANNRQVFPIVRMYTAYMPSYVSGIWSFLYCAKQYDPLKDFRDDCSNKISATTRYYNPAIHRASFALPNHIKKQFNL